MELKIGKQNKSYFPKDLSKRELEIAHLLLKDLSFEEIGEICFITEKTVKFHSANIYRKCKISVGDGQRTKRMSFMAKYMIPIV